MVENLKHKTAKGLFWGGVGNWTLQLMNLFFGLFLARLLSPADYGVVGALAIFSSLAGILAESGFILAVVNKKEVTGDDYNAMFWFNLGMGTFLYLLLFCCAPLIARFYHQPAMVGVSRLLFLSFLVGSISAAPTAYIFRHMKVKERSICQIIGILVSGTVGVVCAFKGWGYWALALQTVLFSAVTSLGFWVVTPWRPRLSFKRRNFMEMLPFSSKVLVTSAFTVVNNNIFATLLGRFFPMRQVGFYTQGNKWTMMGSNAIVGMVNSVGQPLFREANTDNARLQKVFHKMVRFLSFVAFPVMLGLALVSPEAIVLAITDKWLPAVPIMRILCVWGAFLPIATLYGNLMNSINRPDIYMWSTIALGIVQLLMLVAVHSLGIRAMLVAFVSLNLCWLLVWQYFAHRLVGIRLLQVLGDVLPYLAVAALGMAAAYVAAMRLDHVLLRLLVKVAVMAGIYVFLMWWLKSAIFQECVRYILKKEIRYDDASQG